MEHQLKKVKVNNADLNITFLVIFSICVILWIYLMETTPLKTHSLVWQYFVRLPSGKTDRWPDPYIRPQAHLGPIKNTSPNLRVKMLSKIQFLWKIWQYQNFSFSSRKLRKDHENSRSRLDAWDWRKLFSVLSQSMRLGDKNSRSRLDVRDWIWEILVLVSRVEKCFSLLSGWTPIGHFLPLW